MTDSPPLTAEELDDARRVTITADFGDMDYVDLRNMRRLWTRLLVTIDAARSLAAQDARHIILGFASERRLQWSDDDITDLAARLALATRAKASGEGLPPEQAPDSGLRAAAERAVEAWSMDQYGGLERAMVALRAALATPEGVAGEEGHEHDTEKCWACAEMSEQGRAIGAEFDAATPTPPTEPRVIEVEGADGVKHRVWAATPTQPTEGMDVERLADILAERFPGNDDFTDAAEFVAARLFTDQPSTEPR